MGRSSVPVQLPTPDARGIGSLRLWCSRAPESCLGGGVLPESHSPYAAGWQAEARLRISAIQRTRCVRR